jgi:o-succinylbenzoate synthase
MALQFSYFKKVFHFNFKARTSRGLMRDKTSWFIKVHHHQHADVVGIGECGPLAGLSPDARPDFEEVLRTILEKLSGRHSVVLEDIYAEVPPEFPSIIFGLETALLDLNNGGQKIIYRNDFLTSQPIPINGLIWMGDFDFLMSQITTKIAAGFTCIKMKVGGLDFDRECDTLNYIRRRYFRDNITIRLDANGAFKIDEVLFRLEQLKRFSIHSIEQPIKPGQPEMEELCRKSPVPIAFDEELIGVNTPEEKKKLLQTLKPQFIILKPTLHGGIRGCNEWISLAEQHNCGWWITSALESSIGLNSICQYTANFHVKIPQGLGTGSIYENNFPSPLKAEKGKIFMDASIPWEVEE